MGRIKLLFPYALLLIVVAAVVASNSPRKATERSASKGESLVCGPCGMAIERDRAVKAVYNGTMHYFCSDSCRDAFENEARPSSDHADPATRRTVDVVCHMEVNPSWQVTARYHDVDYYFCTERCRERFEQDPEEFLADKCAVCGIPLADVTQFEATYLGKTYRLCSESHRQAFKADPAAFFMHMMWGVPGWMYYASIAVVLLISFGLFDVLGRRGGSGNGDWSRSSAVARSTTITRDSISGEGERLYRGSIASTGSGAAISLPILSASAVRPANAAATAVVADRFDLLTIRWIRAAVRSRVFRFCLQAAFVAMFALIVAAGLFGNQNPALNIAPILTWTIWWAVLIILIMFAGKAWCYVCPWDAIAGWTEKLAFWRKTDSGLSLGLKWPRIVRNILIATILFIGLTWVELGFGVTLKPRVTAYLAIAMLLMAIVSAMLFDRKSFCRYGCLVGRVSGLYALFGGMEVRSKSASTCKSCKTKECVTGSETAYGCPTFLYPGKLSTNTYCIQCMECVQACPHDNLALNLRPWGTDLAIEGKPRADEAYLALLMLAITGFHGLTMTPVWKHLVDGLRVTLGVGRIPAFSAGMALLMLGPIAIYAMLVGMSKLLADRSGASTLSYRDYFIRYAYCMLPIALFYHVAHNLEHLLMEGPKIVSMISDPFGWGWNVLGTARWVIPPMISLDKLWLLQVFLVLVGHVYSLWVANKTSRRLFGDARTAFRSQLPMLIGMICFSVFSLWLLKQPMEMRTSAM